MNRSSHRRRSVKKRVLRNFAKFTGKHLCQSLFLIKKETLAKVFPCEFCEISKNSFFAVNLWTAAPGKYEVVLKLIPIKKYHNAQRILM